MAETVAWRTVRLAEDEMKALAVRMAAVLQPPLVVYLVGDLGAGKTTFTRALVQALGHAGSVKSPTYGLLEHYTLPFGNVLHLDLYRLGHPEELEYLGIADLLDPQTVLLVEWPERGVGFLPTPDVEVRFSHSGKLREVGIVPKSDSGKSICERLSPLFKQVSS